jgi:glycosyltransferase involved in cell wall biosynthesis
MQKGDFQKKELLDEFITHRHLFLPKIHTIERMERETAKYASQIIAPSLYLKGIVEKWGVPSNRINVIYNEVQPFPEGASREEARRQFNVEEKRVLFYGGRAVPWKNIDFIIQLLPKLADRDVVLVVAGDGPSLERWKEASKRFGIDDRVMFVGKLDRKGLGEWYRAADLFVLPSGYEGFPNVVAEAVSFNLPVFVSDRGGNPETYGLYGSDFIRVLPYLDESKWLYALNVDWPKPIQPVKHVQTMVQSTEALLKSIL